MTSHRLNPLVSWEGKHQNFNIHTLTEYRFLLLILTASVNGTLSSLRIISTQTPKQVGLYSLLYVLWPLDSIFYTFFDSHPWLLIVDNCETTFRSKKIFSSTVMLARCPAHCRIVPELLILNWTFWRSVEPTVSRIYSLVFRYFFRFHIFLRKKLCMRLQEISGSSGALSLAPSGLMAFSSWRCTSNHWHFLPARIDSELLNSSYHITTWDWAKGCIIQIKEENHYEITILNSLSFFQISKRNDCALELCLNGHKEITVKISPLDIDPSVFSVEATFH